jgi:hypothetical protein
MSIWLGLLLVAMVGQAALVCNIMLCGRWRRVEESDEERAVLAYPIRSQVKRDTRRVWRRRYQRTLRIASSSRLALHKREAEVSNARASHNANPSIFNSQPRRNETFFRGHLAHIWRKKRSGKSVYSSFSISRTRDSLWRHLSYALFLSWGF